MKRTLQVALIVALLLGGGVVSAREFFQNRQCLIPADQTIVGTVLVLCENLVIDGTINGNLLGASVRTTINGEINGNVYLASGELTINGKIDRTLHFVGIQLKVMPPKTPDTESPPTIAEDVFAGTLTTSIGKGSRVGGNVLVLSYEWNVDGTVGGELSFWGSHLAISGSVEGNVYATVGDPASDSSQIRTLLLPFGFDITLDDPGFSLAKGARIGGALDYSGPVEGTLDGNVMNGTEFHRVTAALPTLDEPLTVVVYARQVLTEFSSLLAVGLLGMIFLPNFWQRPMVNLRLRPIPSFGTGLLAFILSFPIVFILILLMVLVIFIFVIVGLEGVAVAVGFALLIVNSTFIGLFYFLAIYVARVMVAWAIGRFFLSAFRIEPNSRYFAVGSLVVGIFALSVVVALPAFGWVMNALALFLGLGTLLSVLIEYLTKIRETPPTSVPYPPNALKVNMPIIPPSPTATLKPNLPLPLTPNDMPLGMANLPDGFNPDKFFGE